MPEKVSHGSKASPWRFEGTVVFCRKRASNGELLPSDPEAVALEPEYRDAVAAPGRKTVPRRPLPENVEDDLNDFTAGYYIA